jgi:hypothetical protein
VRVLAGCGLVVAGALVLTVSTLVVFAVGASVPIPLGLIMAGVRAPPEEVLRTLAGLNAIMISLCAFPILAIISVVAVVRSEAVKPLTTASGHSERVSGPLWMLSLGAVATWAVVLPFTQPPQQLRSRVEEHVEHGQFSEATAILASHPRSAFPPHWKPPPGPGGDGAQLRRMLELGLEGRLPEWAFANYFDALKRSMGSYGWWHRPAADEFRLYARLAERDESFRDVIAAEHDVLTRLLHEADEEGDIEKHGAIESLLEITGARATSRPAP